jgi:hypothetical protein
VAGHESLNFIVRKNVPGAALNAELKVHLAHQILPNAFSISEA